MIDFKLSTFHHLKAVHQALARFRAVAAIDVGSFALEVLARGRQVRFFPQFIYSNNGRVSYSMALRPEARGFIGWRPYTLRRWDAGCGKFAFKEFCVAKKLPTPRYSRSDPEDMNAYLIKEDSSSFGRGMQGPFTRLDPGVDRPRLPANGYFEEFIPGEMVKAWYWNDRLLCLERQPMPTITGDGASTGRELISRLLKEEPSQSDLEVYSEVLAFQGLGVEDIVEAGRSVIADFRFGTALNHAARRGIGANVDEAENPLFARLAEMGPALFLSIPLESRGLGTLYTIDAIAEETGKVWLLEMNSNPQVHPDAYLGMFESLFRSRQPHHSTEAPPPLRIPGGSGSLIRYC